MTNEEWFAAHTEYLKSPEWAFRRGQVLNRDGYRCQAKMPGCQRDAVQVHHLTYAHWRSEPLFDLIGVCVKCHDQITEIDRGRRQVAQPKPAVSDGAARLVEDYLAGRVFATVDEISTVTCLSRRAVQRALQSSANVGVYGQDGSQTLWASKLVPV